MTEDIDARLGSILRGDTPSGGGALFRIGVMERRARNRFRRRSIVLGAAAAVVAAVMAVVWIAIGAGVDLVAIIAGVVLCAAVAVSVVFSAPGVVMLVRRVSGKS